MLIGLQYFPTENFRSEQHAVFVCSVCVFFCVFFCFFRLFFSFNGKRYLGGGSNSKQTGEHLFLNMEKL